MKKLRLNVIPWIISVTLGCGYLGQNACAAPGVAEPKQARIEYHYDTGELIVSLNQIYLFQVESRSRLIVPDRFDPGPTNSPSLATRNASRVGVTALGTMTLIERSMGSIGAGIPCSDLTLIYAHAINPPPVHVPAGPNGRFRCVPEPAVGSLVPLAGLWLARQRWATTTHNSVRRKACPADEFA